MTYLRNLWIAHESGWRAYRKQAKKRLTELRRRAVMPDPLKEQQA